MQEPETIKKYVDDVCQQIRWRKVHPVVTSEIENHIYDQRDAYIASGSDIKTATDNAVLQMGDAVVVGRELDKTHKPQCQWTMLSLTAVLMGIGLLMNLFIFSSVDRYSNFHPVFFIVAIAIMFACYYIDFTVLGKYAMHIYIFVLILSMLSFLFTTRHNGAHWIAIGPLAFAFPLSYLSLIFPLAYALLIYTLRSKGLQGILLCGVGYLPFAIILLLIPSQKG